MNCKICGSNNLFKELAKNPLDKNEHFTYICCRNCKIMYLEGIDSKTIPDNYDINYNDYQEEVYKPEFLYRIIDFFYFPRDIFVIENSKAKDSILDIGCGKGSFLISLKNSFKEIYCTELNPHALKIAKSKLKNLKVLNLRLKDTFKTFDVITMWHVLEHIENPKIFLNNLKKLMDSNTKLIIEVPNSESLNYSIFKSNYMYTALPEHLFFYNLTSLKFLLNKEGFVIEKVFYPKFYPLLFAKHFKIKILRFLLFPVSLFIYFIAPLFGKSEFIRLVISKSR